MRSTRVGLSVSFASALVVGFVGPVPVAQAATITPTVFTDDNTDNGNCTLREAIISANTDAADDACTAGSGPDQIALAAGSYELTVGPAGDDAAANGDLDITDPDGLMITGNPAGSTVDGNSIDRVFHVRAGASATFDLLTITGGNEALGFGGGIFVRDGSTANVTHTTLTGNKAFSEGGAIDVLSPGSTLNLSDSAIVGNSAYGPSGDGGALEYDSDTTANVTNTTISGNSAVDTGGAIETEGGTGNFLNVTITSNSAPDQGGIVQTDPAGVVNLKGTILAGNTVTGVNPECDAVTSLGHNLIASPSGCAISGQQATDITGVDPLLGPLADNGGPTQTHALLKGSPAIDAGPPDAPPTDQRGAPRSPDIGAYELVLCGKVPVNRIGTDGDDALTGTPAPDGLLGLAGKDLLRGKAGRDGLCGGPGKDRLKGGGGNDRLDGGPGKDLCAGQAGKKDRARKCETEKAIP